MSELKKINPTCRVYYIEASTKMLEIAKARATAFNSNEIIFINGTEVTLHELTGIRFDSVIANFYLDLFGTAALTAALGHVKGVINQGSQILISDFVDRTWWQGVLLFVMYRFFRWTCSIEASRLPDWEDQLKNNGIIERDSRAFFSGFIKSCLCVYDKKEASGIR
jgi:ubiquinone/menaquinone biosynthesis C-methylase UbiE